MSSKVNRNSVLSDDEFPVLGDIENMENGSQRRTSSASRSTLVLSNAPSEYESREAVTRAELAININEKYTTSDSKERNLPLSPTSPNGSSDEEENEPLLEDDGFGGHKNAPEVPQTETKKPLISAEYKIALSHFSVSACSRSSTSVLTYGIENIFLLYSK